MQYFSFSKPFFFFCGQNNVFCPISSPDWSSLLFGLCAWSCTIGRWSEETFCKDSYVFLLCYIEFSESTKFKVNLRYFLHPRHYLAFHTPRIYHFSTFSCTHLNSSYIFFIDLGVIIFGLPWDHHKLNRFLTIRPFPNELKVLNLIDALIWGASLIAQLLQNPTVMQETLVGYLGQEDLLEKG